MQKFRVSTANGFIEFTNIDVANAYITANSLSVTAETVTEDLTNPDAMKNYVISKIDAAKLFGSALMNEYGAINTLKQLTPNQVKTLAQRLSLLQQLISSGSLYAALDELGSIIPDDLVLQADIDYFTVKIKTYLGIPL